MFVRSSFVYLAGDGEAVRKSETGYLILNSVCIQQFFIHKKITFMKCPFTYIHVCIQHLNLQIINLILLITYYYRLFLTTTVKSVMRGAVYRSQLPLTTTLLKYCTVTIRLNAIPLEIQMF